MTHVRMGRPNSLSTAQKRELATELKKLIQPNTSIWHERHVRHRTNRQSIREFSALSFWSALRWQTAQPHDFNVDRVFGRHTSWAFGGSWMWFLFHFPDRHAKFWDIVA